MNGNAKYGGYKWEDFKSQPYRDRSFLEKLFNFAAYGVSPSELEGAHADIDKLIANADANAKIAEIATMSKGTDLERLFRVMNPDSTIKVISSTAHKYYYD